MFKTKKAQSAGLITGLVFGVASLVVAVIIAFVVVSTLTGAGLFSSGRIDAVPSSINETTATNVSSDGTTAFGNSSTGIGIQCSIVSVFQETGNATANDEINSDNYTVSELPDNGGCRITYNEEGNDNYNNSLWIINSTATSWGRYEQSSQDVSENLTDGVGNVSEKIPTVLLIAAIVLILGVLVLLVGAWQRMRIGGGSI